MAWQFRLAPLLRYRARTEDLRALDLARATELREASARNLTAASARLEGARETLLRTGGRGTTGIELQVMATTIELAARRARAAATRLAADDTEVDAARTRLVEASRDRRILERLEEVQREAHLLELDEQRTRQLDDIASVYHVWRHRLDPPAAGRGR